MPASIILPIATSILNKLASLTGDLVLNHVVQEIKAAKSAKKDLKVIEDKLTAICAVLEDADQKQYTSKGIKVWLKDLKSVVYDIDDLLDEMAYDALLRSVNEGHLLLQLRYYISSSNPLVLRIYFSRKINALQERLLEIAAKKNEFNLTERPVEAPSVQRDLFHDCAYVDRASIVGRDEAKYEVINRLLADGDASNPSVLPITGMGGIGKTALAKLVFEGVPHDRFDIKLWACVSDNFDIRKLLEDIIKNGDGGVASNCTLEQLVTMLQDLLKEKKYFLVLDDIWEDNNARWKELKSIFENVGKIGSVILVTTREAKVASITKTVKPYNLDRLSDNICWRIFKELAFADGEEQRYQNLTKIGKSIVEKCRGIPLAVKCLGSLLRNVRDEGEWHRIDNMDNFTKLHEQYDHVNRILKLSYDKLPWHLKPCFAHLVLDVKDSNYFLKYQTYRWSALGLLQLQDGREEIEDCGHRYSKELVSRSLLQEPSFLYNGELYSYKMHDLLHDLAMDVQGEELAVVTRDQPKVHESCRHLVWGHEISKILPEFPRELIKAQKARSFRFAYKMNCIISQSFIEGILSNMSYLRILDLGYSHFEKLPSSIEDLKHLRLLNLSFNPILKTLPNTICELLNLQALFLLGCEQLQELPKKIYRLVNLRCLTVTTCQRSLAGTNFNKLPSLRDLQLIDCEGLESLWDVDDVGRLTSLRCLIISGCPRLTCLPNSMKLLTALEMLVIYRCEELDLEKEEGLSGLQSLRTLSIRGVPRLTRLPHGMQSAASSLQCLVIEDGLIELPDWLQSFTSLKMLAIVSCPRLLALPKGFHNLKSLQLLKIHNCPQLAERCGPNGVDYPLIKHVPEIILK